MKQFRIQLESKINAPQKKKPKQKAKPNQRKTEKEAPMLPLKDHYTLQFLKLSQSQGHFQELLEPKTPLKAK